MRELVDSLLCPASVSTGTLSGRTRAARLRWPVKVEETEMERVERREEGSSDERMSSGEHDGRNGSGEPPILSPGCEGVINVVYA